MTRITMSDGRWYVIEGDEIDEAQINQWMNSPFFAIAAHQIRHLSGGTNETGTVTFLRTDHVVCIEHGIG
jgi:DNA-binding IclR family transcriptional regulator